MKNRHVDILVVSFRQINIQLFPGVFVPRGYTNSEQTYFLEFKSD